MMALDARRVGQQVQRRQLIGRIGLFKGQARLGLGLRAFGRLDRLAHRVLHDLLRLGRGDWRDTGHRGRGRFGRVIFLRLDIDVSGVVIGHRLDRLRGRLGRLALDRRLERRTRRGGGRRRRGGLGRNRLSHRGNRSSGSSHGSGGLRHPLRRQGRLGRQTRGRHMAGERRFGRQGHLVLDLHGAARRGVRDQRRRPPAPPLGQRFGQILDRLNRLTIGHAGADHIGDLGADPVIAIAFVIKHQTGIVEQFRLGHVHRQFRFGPADQRRHPGQQPATFRLWLRLHLRCGGHRRRHRRRNRGGHRCRHRGRLRRLGHDRALNHRRGGHLRNGGGGGFSLGGGLGGRFGLALRPDLGPHPRCLGRAARALAHGIQHHRIGHHHGHERQPRDPAQLGLGKAHHKEAHGDRRDPHQEGHQLDRQMRSNRQERQQTAHHRVAKEPAQPKIMRRLPLCAWDQRRGIDRQDRHRERRHDQPVHHPLFAQMQHEPRAPGQEDPRKAQGPPAHDHEERRAHRGPRPTKPVLHRRVGRDHPVRIVRRIGQDHRQSRQPQRQKHDPDQFLAAFFNRRLHGAVQKRIPAAGVICHA